MDEYNENETILLGKTGAGKNGVRTFEAGASRNRLQVLERVKDLPSAIQKALKDGKMQISDQVLFSSSAANGTAVQIVKTDAGKAVGKTNLAQGRHDKYFLVMGIALLFSEADQLAENYNKLLPPMVANGDITLKVDSKEYVSELPVEMIVSHNAMPTNKKWNFYRLDNPKWIAPLKDIEVNVRASETIPEGGYLKALLVGAEIRPY